MAPLGQETNIKCLRVKRIALSWFVSGLIAWDISNLVSQGHSSLIDAQGSCWKLRVMAKIRLLDSGKCCCFKANFILPAAGTELDPAEVDPTDYTDFGSVSTLRLLTASHCIRSPPNCWNCPNCMALRLRIRSRSIGARSSRGIPRNRCLPHQRITEAPPPVAWSDDHVWLGVLLSEGLLNPPAWSDLRHARLMTECWINDHHGNVRETSAILWYLPL